MYRFGIELSESNGTRECDPSSRDSHKERKDDEEITTKTLYELNYSVQKTGKYQYACCMYESTGTTSEGLGTVWVKATEKLLRAVVTVNNS